MHPLAHVIPAALAKLLHDAPVSAGKVSFAWGVAVGPALEHATSVRLEGRVLIVDAPSGQWAREVRRSSRTILARLEPLLGKDTVTRLVVRQNPSSL